MRVTTASLLGLAVALTPAAASARSLAREGTVSLLAGARLSLREGAEGPGPMGAISFGFKPDPRLEVAIDVGVSPTSASNAVGAHTVLAVPLTLGLEWTPTPAWEARPVLGLQVGKALLQIDGPAGEVEATPFAFAASAGLAWDLNSDLGLEAHAGWLSAAESVPGTGWVDGGGAFALAGVYFRFEPVPERRR